MADISVVIPLAPDETAWQTLLVDLETLPDGTEILFVVAENSPISFEPIALPKKIVKVLSGKSGRASQMNAGAIAAQGKFLWFLHADSKFASNSVPALLHAMQTHSDRLLYFDLGFLGDGSCLMRINQWGVLSDLES